MMTAVTTWYLFQSMGSVTVEDVLVKGAARGWLWAAAVVTTLWGLALFLTDAGPSALIWVWPADLLTSRLIAVMLWTLAATAVYSLRSQDALRVTLAVMIAYGIGVGVANVWNPTAIKPLYVSLFAVLSIGSGILLFARKTATD